MELLSGAKKTDYTIIERKVICRPYKSSGTELNRIASQNMILPSMILSPHSD